jgi:enoyl-CoA hydratase/carnithine racemase
VSRGKRSFHAQYDLDRAAAYAHVESVIPEAFDTDDTKEGIAAFLEKREPKWTGN